VDECAPLGTGKKTMEKELAALDASSPRMAGMGSHSSTFQLNLSRI
jgi:hypothetical protein